VKIETKAYGLMEVDEMQKISFPQGLFGFEGLTEYVLLDSDQQPFYWLQSTEQSQVAFVLVNPFLFRPDYELDINNEEMAEIGITSPENALIFAIVTVPFDNGTLTANLQGPLIINKETRIGMQAVLADSRWRTKHDILAELEAVRK
jgi:flagellar assembly factor FliW